MIKYLSLLITTFSILSAQGQNPGVTLDSIIGVTCGVSTTSGVYISTNNSGCSSASVVINEIYVNPSGSNDGANPNAEEFIELLAPAGTDISCYVLTDGDWTLTFPSGTVIPADGFFTIGNDAVWGAGTFDLDAENCNCFTDGVTGSGLLIMTNGGEYLSLYDDFGNLIDGIIYGNPSTANTPPNGGVASGGIIATAGLAACPTSIAIPNATSFQTTAVLPADGEVIARNPDGTGAFVASTPTLGACNFAGTGSGTFTYSWSNGSTQEDLVAVPAGSYTVTITDNTGATVVGGPYTVGGSSAVSLVTDSIQSPLCGGGIDGAAFVTASNGQSPYSYLWSNGSIQEDLSNVIAGTYTVTVTDINACTATTAVIITEPTPLNVLTDSLFHAGCNVNDGAIYTSVTGGIAPYTYIWSSGQNTDDLENLAAGTYDLTVLDFNLCTASTTFVVAQASPINVTLDSVVSALCGDTTGTGIYLTGDTSSSFASLAINEIYVNPSGGNDGANPDTEEYIELIGPAGMDISCYVLTDGDFTITMPAGTTIPADGLFSIGNDAVWGAGTFDLDAENCNCFTDVNIPLGDGLLIMSNVGEYLTLHDDTGAFLEGVQYGVNQNANNTAPGGSAANSGQINTIALAGCPATITIPNVSALDVIPLAPANGEGIARDPDLTGAWVVTTPTLNVYNSSSTVGGGSGTAYSYLWSNGDTTEDLQGIGIGTYTVTVSDGGGCDAILGPFVITDSSSVDVNLTALQNVSCGGLSDGSIDITTVGGTAPFTYAWSDGQSTEDAINLAPGNYGVTITDANMCMISYDTIVNDGLYVIASVTSAINPTCAGDTNGIILTTASGGSPNYTYLWSDGSTTADNQDLVAGTYTLTVTDINGCVDTTAFTLVDPEALVVNIDLLTETIACDGSPTGALATALSGGTAPFTYAWSNGASTAGLSNLAEATYVVTVSDANACTSVASAQVVAPLVPTLTPVFTTTNTNTAGISLGNTVEASVGTDESGQGVTYTWSGATTLAFNPSDGATTVITPSEAIAYTITVTAISADGCNTEATLELTVEEYLGMPTGFTPNSDNQNDLYRPVNLNPAYINQFTIFNRFGNKVYDSAELIGGGWDGSFNGQSQARDVYIYVLEYQLPDMTEPVVVRGEFMLIR
ncbi:MAG: gliding motility-associated C-terminal domain-containing protein [Saprospiraceae bacterium]|nr:gliding motility-associated C-terminal domain-containing protein [Saprospiraceae bacterium]